MIAGIVLAAGRSSRLGRPKQLLPVQGEPLLRFTLQRILTTSLDTVYVVLGHQAEEIARLIADLPVHIVDNPDAEQGQSTSVLAGIHASAPSKPDAVMVLLGDQPQVNLAVINALTSRWQETHTGVIAPRYSDGIGNPILFDRAVLPEFTTLSGDTGARAIVRAYQARGDISLVDVPSPAPTDIDTEADYAALLASLAAEQQTVTPCIDWCSEPE